MGSCSTAFKFGRIIIYINVHIEANFHSKKVCLFEVMVLFVLSLPKWDASHGWASHTIEELAHKQGPATGGSKWGEQLCLAIFGSAHVA